MLTESIALPAGHLSEVEIGGEIFYKISNADEMRTFFMSIVSDSNHWLFVASNGGISAGRKHAGYALFPYYTDDKIIDTSEITGAKTILQVSVNGVSHIWEPFSIRSEGAYSCRRNIYKNRYSNKIIFEEVNETLGISFQYGWYSSNLYGFVRKAKMVNHSNKDILVTLLDGLQNILPYGVESDLQTKTSNLADAYKRSELMAETGLGIFALSAIIVDKAEPSEALKANVAWSLGLSNSTYLLSVQQLQHFRRGLPVKQEVDVKGEKGCYFLINEISLEAGAEKQWMIVANVNQTHAGIIQLAESIRDDKTLYQKVEDDVALGTALLIQMVAAADGLQSTADGLKDTRHFSNVLFNIMRGGIFDSHYTIEKLHFSNYLQKANGPLFKDVQKIMQSLPDTFSVFTLEKLAAQSGHADFLRLSTEYLPLKFSRRHGDPSRPWNQFSINIRSEIDGSKILDYEGNWRDIFQNWEALAFSYPGFIEGMIFKFLNASTFDGYNPYRVTRDGFDWETIEPDNPWSYIGYWGDHQIIYLLKFFELLEKVKPGTLVQWLHKTGFVYANVPYRIKSYTDILHNPKDTIEFDHKGDLHIRERMKQMGADGALLTNASGHIHHISFCEKILATVLAKLSNLIPDGGIWMNTQRPEWNDANNALVGNGLSMVTLCYLRRFLTFFEPLFANNAETEMVVSAELSSFFEQVNEAFEQYKHLLTEQIDDTERKKMANKLGLAGSEYRKQVYFHGFSGEKKPVAATQILNFIHHANAFLEHAVEANKRSDALYHTYNLLSYNEEVASVGHLSEMLEGQVAVLSSGLLDAQDSLHLLNALRKSALYRKDQHSYILYPNKNLPSFLEKNTIRHPLEKESRLIKQLLEEGNVSIVEKDINGQLHFNGNFRNANDVVSALQNLNQRHQSLVAEEKQKVLDAFEDVFNHKAFTGRSGTFFGYEGLGSIYWHMVSKLLLAVQETCLRAIEQQEADDLVGQLVQHYYDINEGIGVHKPPQLYGAFPTDPYSHTPFGKGAQQPGMTGQVKEDIICRFGELGVVIKNGQLHFSPVLLRRKEFSITPFDVEYVTLKGHKKQLSLPAESLVFTYCQVPVIYQIHPTEGIEMVNTKGAVIATDKTVIPENLSAEIWNRTDELQLIKVFIKSSQLKY